MSEHLKQGSIEDALRQTQGAPAASGSSSDTPHNDVDNLEVKSAEVADDKKEALHSLELKKKARQIQVSTEDSEVKAYLRQLGEPICYFGEDAADRRERLRFVLATLGEAAIRKTTAPPGAGTQPEIETNTVWYHEGSQALKAARLFIAQYSLIKARNRLEKAREYYSTVPQALRKARAQEYHKHLRSHIDSDCSQIGDTRPLSYCQFSPDDQYLATASWTGVCKVWSVPGCELIHTLRGHLSQANCVVWHPHVTVSRDSNALALASSAHDGSVHLWSMSSEEPLADIEGHAPHRVSRLAFHPSGRFLATACFDWSWRLWDIEVQDEILHQEGHSKAVYDVAFHPDGSLLLSGGLDSFGRVWDLRTGRCIMFLEGHLQGIVGVSWADNGYHMVSASEDHSCKVWDLRQQSSIYTIPAHTNVVSAAKFQPGDNNFIITSSYDTTVKVWGHPIWTPIRTLTGHEGKIMHVDVSHSSQYIASCSFDRHFKLWTTS